MIVREEDEDDVILLHKGEGLHLWRVNVLETTLTMLSQKPSRDEHQKNNLLRQTYGKNEGKLIFWICGNANNML